jgi:formylglycine-generating enzyme required for sulfatase activity
MQIAKELKLKRLEYKIDRSIHTTLFKHFFDGIKWIDAVDGDAMEELKTRVFDLLNHKNETKKEPTERPPVHANSNIESLMKRIYFELELGKTEDANRLIDKVFDLDIEHVDAWVAKLLISLKMSNLDALFERIEHADIRVIEGLEKNKAIFALHKLDHSHPVIAKMEDRKKELKRQREEELKRQKEEELKREREEKLKREREEKLKREREEKLKREREEKLKRERERKLLQSIKEVRVGNADEKYTFPVGEKDREQATIEGGYWIATTQTTYEQWYEVRKWAEANGYVFQNKGREGSNGNTGKAPTESKKHEPVTTITWRDAIVWTNALSEIMGFELVYRTKEGNIIRNSNANIVDSAVQNDTNGFRLPTMYEWEMAARWRNESGDGSIMAGGRYWTPGQFASGAIKKAKNNKETKRVAWYSSNSRFKTHPAGEKTPNDLGLYDMSGNVWEWTYTASGSYRFIRGGSYYSYTDFLRVGYVYYSYPGSASGRGFRLLRGQ